MSYVTRFVLSLFEVLRVELLYYLQLVSHVIHSVLSLFGNLNDGLSAVVAVVTVAA
jgi:hypothetical protein